MKIGYKNWADLITNFILTGDLLPIAMVAEIGNLLLTFMSAWIVGKVEAPAKANIMEPNAEMDDFVLKEKLSFPTFEKSICWRRGELFLRQLGPVHNTGDYNEETGNHCGDQGSNSNGPEVFRSSHPSKWGETSGYNDHPDTEREWEPGI